MSAVRFFTLLGTGCIVLGFVMVFSGSEALAVPSGILFAAGFLIGSVLWIRRAFFGIRGLVSDAKAVLSSDTEEVRIVDVTDPKGFFGPRSTVTVEVEGEDGTTRQFDRDIPMPWPWALAYKVAKRFPATKTPDLGEELAAQLRRQGMNVSATHGDASADAVPVDPATSRS